MLSLRVPRSTVHQVRRSVHHTSHYARSFRCTLSPSQHNRVLLLIVVSRKKPTTQNYIGNITTKHQTRGRIVSVCNLASSKLSERKLHHNSNPAAAALSSLRSALGTRGGTRDYALVDSTATVAEVNNNTQYNTSFEPGSVQFSSVVAVFFLVNLLLLPWSCVFWLLFLSSEYCVFCVCVCDCAPLA